jgi:outer membrane biogenesis lipoprotein LolB
MRELLMGYFKYFFVVIFVSGCTSLPTKVAQQDFGKYDSMNISRINHWEIKGKLGFKSTAQGGSASIRWLQHKTNYKIILSGPFA